LAAAVTLAVSGAIAGVGVAGAAEEQANADVYARDAGLCFSTVASAAACADGETADVEIETGDTVTWHFAGGPGGTPGQGHNAAARDNSWKVPPADFPTSGTGSRTFNAPGEWEFYCQAHPTMTGTVTVTGEPTATPTEEPTEEPTVEPTADPTQPPASTATPPPTPPTNVPNDPVTPRPGGGTDTVDPAVGGVRLTARHRAVRVRFTLSEPATVTIAVRRRGARRVLKSTRVQARAGTRTVTLRSRKLKPGRYRIEIRARDAFGNRSATSRKTLAIRR
jgi:plastocyanin